MKTKRILIRAGLTPYHTVSYERLRHLMGDNLGNLVYANSIFRALTVDDSVEIVPTRYKTNFTGREAAVIDEEYDAFVIPFADAIRHDFIPEFLSLAAFIRKLHIPVVVLGCGIRAPYEPGRNEDRLLNFAARTFFREVLEHSAKIGVRGEITGSYLRQLGFQEEQDYTVIGCPSLYTWGERPLVVKDSWKKVLHDPASACISYNMSQGSGPAQIRFIRENAKRFKEAVYLPQRGEELELMYAGVTFPPPVAEGFPTTLSDPLYLSGDVRMYASVASWLSFLGTRDFSFGTRMHGNVAALIAGTPALFCPFDARTRELALYHGLPHIRPEELDNAVSGADVADLLEIAAKKDFSSHIANHARNFAHYVDFLDENGLAHIYHKEAGETAHDRKAAAARQLPPLIPLTRTDPAETARRLRRYHEGVFVKKTTLLKETKKLAKKILRRNP